MLIIFFPNKKWAHQRERERERGYIIPIKNAMILYNQLMVAIAMILLSDYHRTIMLRED